MNRKLAHGRHLEWGLRAVEQCNARGAFDGESEQRKQRSNLGVPKGLWLPDPKESEVPAAHRAIDDS
jgi:hypothetical protein